jgi:hypothetical protein
MMRSASSHSLFTSYKTLKEGEIRLLNLQPRLSHLASQLDWPSSEIECSFSLTNLHDPLPFEALSYTWGDREPCIPVKLDGELVKITKNLGLALQHLRLDDSPRTLWVDALCINQLDYNERNQQVTAMRYIYEQATGVVIFLGEAWDGHEIAIEFLQLVSQNDFHYNPSLTPHITVRGLDTTTDKLRDEIVHFFQLPWWDRIWVIQEYVLAKSIIFQVGNTLLAGHVVEQAYKLLEKHYLKCCRGSMTVNIPSPTYGLSMVNAIRKIDAISTMRTWQDDLNMLQTLALFRARRAYDARDKIYGILGLHFVSEITRVVADYQMSTRQLYIEFATRYIAQTGTLDILNHAGYLNQGGLDVPSYVPDWAAPMSESEHVHYVLRANAFPGSYDASNGRAAEFKVLNDDRILLKGTILDKIAIVGSVYDIEMNSLALLNECLQIMTRSLAGRQAKARRHRETANGDVSKRESTNTPLNGLDEQLWRILSGNIGVILDGHIPKWRRVEPEKDMGDFHAWRAWIADGHPSGLPPCTGAAAFQQVVQINAVARKVVVTDGGLIGLAPATSRKGDAIALLYGGKTPFVLRPTTSKFSNMENGYKLIGDSYIDGIMQGEAVEVSVGNEEMDFLIY